MKWNACDESERGIGLDWAGLPTKQQEEEESCMVWYGA